MCLRFAHQFRSPGGGIRSFPRLVGHHHRNGTVIKY
jgi:hypothetical protein